MMYLERLSVEGISTSKYYIPEGQFNTSKAGSDIQMPNCTMYAYCRGYEAMGATDAFPWVRVNGGFGNAKTWYETTVLAKGHELKEGSIAVFDGTYGHVVFIEKKISNTRAIITESNYDSNKKRRDWKYWRKREVDLIPGKATLDGIGPLLGFIYLPINDIRVLTRDSSKNQVFIKEDFTRVRRKPNGDDYIGLYCPTGLYNVIKFEDKGDYRWAQLDEECWVAVYNISDDEAVSWAVIYEASSIEDDTISDLKKQVTRLKEENKGLTTLLNNIKTKLNELLNSI